MQNHRIYGLDILRSVAILSVVISHAGYLVSPNFESTIYHLIIPEGVTIFFVLSGFLIGSILLKAINKQFTIKELTNFWVRRWFRTLPAYYCVLTVLVILNIINDNHGFTYYKKYYLFIQSVGYGIPKLYPESWSLCVEEWFYLLIPFCLFLSICFTNLAKRKIVLFWIITLILAVTILRIYKVNNNQYSNLFEWDTFLRKPLVTRLDSIMFGVIGAYLNYYKVPIWFNKKNILLIIGIVLTFYSHIHYSFFGFDFYSNYFQLTVEPVGALLMLPFFLSVKTGQGLWYRFFTFISTISYSMYLLNYTPFFHYILPLLPNDSHVGWLLAKVAIFATWTTGAATILYYCVEKPFMRVRDSFSKKE